ncbi:MAG: protein translocase subunit SecF [Chloroflexota bacterium]|nr:protein translocase subunit SecF [Chloroflexota bacterium]
MINIVAHRYWFFLISLLLLIPGIVYLALYGLQRGVDFTGGTLWQVEFQQPIDIDRVREVVRGAGQEQVFVQSLSTQREASEGSGSYGVSMRLADLPYDSDARRSLQTALEREFGQFTQLEYTNVGPAVGQEIQNRSLLAVGLTSLGILAYIAFAFRKVNHPFRYGVCAIVAMLHDALLVAGIYAILGRHFGIEVDALFITALLTVIGFSVHDTIVVFDRIRENQLRRYGESFSNIVNYSLVQTLVRSVNTSLTVLITLAALYLFGGVTIRDNFVLALLIGIASGTFSSIFVASLLLVAWENGEFGRLFGRGRGSAATPARA